MRPGLAQESKKNVPADTQSVERDASVPAGGLEHGGESGDHELPRALVTGSC